MLLRSQARGLTVREGMIAIWLTLKPSDLQNPLVLILAGMENNSEVFLAATAAVRQAVSTSNPVAVAQFFYHSCKAIMDGLLRSESGRIVIFSVVETNGRGMLLLPYSNPRKLTPCNPFSLPPKTPYLTEPGSNWDPSHLCKYGFHEGPGISYQLINSIQRM